MAVKIRLTRLGRKNNPFYRIIVTDARATRDGRFIEKLGHYDPLADKAKNWDVNVERAAYWLSVGAQPSETVASFLRKENVWPREKALEYLKNAETAKAAQPVEAPVKAAVEAPVKVPVKAVAEAPAEAPVEAVAEAPAETPVETTPEA